MEENRKLIIGISSRALFNLDESHDIYENPEEGGQAPFLIYQKALEDGFALHERVDTIACLIKS